MLLCVMSHKKRDYLVNTTLSKEMYTFRALYIKITYNPLLLCVIIQLLELLFEFTRNF